MLPDRPLHRVATVATAVLLFAWAFAPACSTDAVGIDACRDIESVRCDLAPTCEGDETSFGISTPEQVENCKTFYNDHCLLGLENVKADPSQDDVDKCISAIEATAKCKTDGVAKMAECTIGDAALEVVSGASDMSPCEVLKDPQNLVRCAFVATQEE